MLCSELLLSLALWQFAAAAPAALNLVSSGRTHPVGARGQAGGRCMLLVTDGGGGAVLGVQTSKIDGGSNYSSSAFDGLRILYLSHL